MYVISKPRRGGKTHEMIRRYLIGSDNILLVMNQQEKTRIIKDYNLSEQAANRIAIWTTALCHHKIEGIKGNILIDNADLLLTELFHRNILCISVTGQDHA